MFKLKILKEIETGASLRSTAKKYDITEKIIREWRKNKYRIRYLNTINIDIKVLKIN